MKRTFAVLSTGILFLAHTSSASACPMCKFALETNEAEPRAYMVSILFMMGMITALFSSVAVLLWWVSKQERKNLHAAGYQHLFENAVSHNRMAKVKA